MDFIIGILLVIVIILILVNFTSISMSDTKGGTCSNNNMSSSIFGGNRGNRGNRGNQYGSSIPSPMLSKEPSALNNKLNLNAQSYDYDYNKYFFM